MCGIAGLWNRAEVRETERLAAVRLMTDAIRHRGPDSFGHWVDPDSGVAFGHRRLAIVDLSEAGAQPMFSASGRYVITFNGEIYNHRELRQPLARAGVEFRGSSDTEVLLALVEREGVIRALQQCRGMFALALWDRAEGKLSLARDRMGEKPLYFLKDRQGVRFASELKALLAGRATPEVDVAAIGDVLERGYIRGERTIFHGVRKLDPGTVVTFDTQRSSGEATTASYWSIQEPFSLSRYNADSDEIVSRFQGMLDTVVRDEADADVALGAFLSGGIDSSLIVATMQRVSSNGVKTFTVAFDEAEYDESGYARRIAEYLGTQHEEIRLTTSDALHFVQQLPELYDEPFADSSQLPTLLICQATRRHVTVALSGDGGDELFGGYAQYLAADRMATTLAAWPGFLHRPLGLLAGSGADLSIWSPAQRDRLARASLLLASSDRRREYETLLSAWPDACRLLAPHLLHGLRERMDQVLPAWPAVRDDVLARTVYDALTYLPDDILVKVDRAAMAFSLETRAPFLDHLIVEFAMALPMEYKIRGGVGKQLLRDALGKLIPVELFERPKRGFAIPLNQWLRTDLRDWAEALLHNTPLLQSVFRTQVVEQIWDRHLAGENHGAKLWRILVVLQWLERQANVRMS